MAPNQDVPEPKSKEAATAGASPGKSEAKENPPPSRRKPNWWALGTVVAAWLCTAIFAIGAAYGSPADRPDSIVLRLGMLPYLLVGPYLAIFWLVGGLGVLYLHHLVLETILLPGSPLEERRAANAMVPGIALGVALQGLAMFVFLYHDLGAIFMLASAGSVAVLTLSARRVGGWLERGKASLVVTAAMLLFVPLSLALTARSRVPDWTASVEAWHEEALDWGEKEEPWHERQRKRRHREQVRDRALGK